jgi:hypothetical protein
MVVDACARKIQIPGMLWINSRECVSCGTRLRLGKHGFQEYPDPAGAPSGTTLAMVCFFFNYTGVVKIFSADFGVRHCSVWRYDLFVIAG